MKSSILVVVGLIVITSSFLAGCASTNPTSSPSSQAQTSTSSGIPTSTASSVQTPATPSAKATTSTSPTNSVNSSGATCQTQHLTLTQGRVGVATGSTYVTYYLQYHGPSTCSMVGYPGFSLLFADGSVIQHPATRDRMAYSPVQLEAGQRAQFVVRSVDGSIPGTGCSSSWKTAQVLVYPPNQTTSIRAPSTIAVCDLSVGPVSAA